MQYYRVNFKNLHYISACLTIAALLIVRPCEAANPAVIVLPPTGNAEASALIQKQQNDYGRQSSQQNFNQQINAQNAVTSSNNAMMAEAKNKGNGSYFVISGLVSMQSANNAARDAIQDCENKRGSGLFKSHMDSVRCSNRIILEAFELADYPYNDIIRKFVEKRLEIARRVDRNKITQEGARLAMQRFIGKMQAEEKRRAISTANY